MVMILMSGEVEPNRNVPIAALMAGWESLDAASLARTRWVGRLGKSVFLQPVEQPLIRRGTTLEQVAYLGREYVRAPGIAQVVHRLQQLLSGHYHAYGPRLLFVYIIHAGDGGALEPRKVGLGEDPGAHSFGRISVDVGRQVVEGTGP